jgi:hypothetical protein
MMVRYHLRCKNSLVPGQQALLYVSGLILRKQRKKEGI